MITKPKCDTQRNNQADYIAHGEYPPNNNHIGQMSVKIFGHPGNGSLKCWGAHEGGVAQTFCWVSEFWDVACLNFKFAWLWLWNDSF